MPKPEDLKRIGNQRPKRRCFLRWRAGAALVGLGMTLLVLPAAAAASEPAQRQYQAQWIWGNVASPQPFQFVRFRKTVELPSRPASATVYITADTFYRLWINGQLAMHGPARSSRGKATVDPIEVGHLLNQGSNTLMIEVFHGVCVFEALAQAPGLLCEIETNTGGKRQVVAATDATWEAAEITAWSRKSQKLGIHRGWLEQFDARRILEEKTQPVIVLGKVGIAPWQKVEMRDIPLPAPLAQVRPVSVVALLRGDGGSATNLPGNDWHEGSEWYRRLQTEQLKVDPTAATNPQGLTSDGQGDAVLHGDGAGITYDLGRGYVGFIGFEVSGDAGQHIEIVSGERFPVAGAVRPGYYINIAMPYILREGRQSFLGFIKIIGLKPRPEGRGFNPIILMKAMVIAVLLSLVCGCPALVRAPGLHPPQNRPLVGRVPSPNVTKI